jgi:hypothetical protein
LIWVETILVAGREWRIHPREKNALASSAAMSYKGRPLFSPPASKDGVAMSGPNKPQRVEELESRAVPSSVPFLATGVSGMLGAHTQGNAAPVLSGMLTGTYTPAPGIPDAGLQFNIHGSGKLSVLGHVTVTGTLHTTGFTRAGHAGGTLVLTTASGSLTLQLEGALQPGFAPLPTHWYFNVVKGAGAYAHVMASGTINFNYAPAVMPMHLLPGQPPPQAGGTFALTLRQMTV